MQHRHCKSYRPHLAWLAVAGLLFAVSARAENTDPVAEWILQNVEQARVEAGAGKLERRAELDSVARERAETIGHLPHEKRLTYGEPVGEQLRASGVRWFRAANAHLDMVRGYMRPEIGLLRSWQNHEQAWSRALGPDYTSIGAASYRAEDGWVVFVAVLVEDLAIPEDLRQVEHGVIRAVNEIRAERGLGELVEMPELSAVARQHSEDMVLRDFVGHVNPDGLGAPERVDLAGIRFVKVAENVQMSRGSKDPVAYAVEQWMTSKGHRRTMLDREFVRTGVGVAIGTQGEFFFTQLFLRPAE